MQVANGSLENMWLSKDKQTWLKES
jgi:hypothetical protein